MNAQFNPNLEIIAEHVESEHFDSTTSKRFRTEMKLFRCKPLKSIQFALASSLRSKSNRLN